VFAYTLPHAGKGKDRREMKETRFVAIGIPMILFEHVLSDFDKDVIDVKLKRTCDIIFCVARFVCCFVLDKINLFVNALIAV